MDEAERIRRVEAIEQGLHQSRQPLAFWQVTSLRHVLAAMALATAGSLVLPAWAAYALAVLIGGIAASLGMDWQDRRREQELKRLQAWRSLLR